MSKDEAKLTMSLLNIEAEKEKDSGKLMISDIIAVNYYDMAQEVDEEFMMSMLKKNSDFLRPKGAKNQNFSGEPRDARQNS